MKSLKQTREILKNIKLVVNCIRTPILFGKGFTPDEEIKIDPNYKMMIIENDYCDLQYVEPTLNPLPELIRSLDNKPLEYIVKAVIWVTQPRYIKFRIMMRYNELKWRYFK